MTSRDNSGSSGDRKAKRGATPSALLVGPSRQYGSEKRWWTGVVLQQACEAMLGRGT